MISHRPVRTLAVALALAVSVAVGLCSGPAAAEETPAAPPEIDWYYSLDQAVAHAATIGRQVAAVFYTDWCKWCRLLDDSTFSDPRITPIIDRLVFARVNAESDTAAAHRYSVRAYPTVIILTLEGQEVDRLVGYLPPEEFEKTMTDYLDGRGTYWDIDRKLKRDSKNPELVFAIAEKYEQRGEIDNSRENYRKVVSLDEKNAEGWTDNALFALARLHREQGKWYKAAEGFRRMLESYPESELRPDAEAYIPWLFEQAGDTTRALEYYQAFVKQYKGSRDRPWAEKRIAALTPRNED
ncbi:MAG TPA: thioredoxin fold domain-containing protein [Acidobacteriota bacterium]|nr:thioredoxin fold domain-containing protein [Acidobacteriota bacterium]